MCHSRSAYGPDTQCAWTRPAPCPAMPPPPRPQPESPATPAPPRGALETIERVAAAAFAEIRMLSTGGGHQVKRAEDGSARVQEGSAQRAEDGATTGTEGRGRAMRAGERSTATGQGSAARAKTGNASTATRRQQEQPAGTTTEVQEIDGDEYTYYTDTEEAHAPPPPVQATKPNTERHGQHEGSAQRARRQRAARREG